MNQETDSSKFQILHKVNIKYKMLIQVFLSYVLTAIIAIFLATIFKISNIPKDTFAEPNSFINTLIIFGIIIIETIIIIILIKIFKKINFLKIIDILATFFSLFGILSLFINNLIIILVLTLGLVLLKEFWNNMWYKNIMIFLVVGFFSAYLGYSLGLFPIMLLLFLIGIYDFIAVFKTKHMVFLANKITQTNNTLFIMDFGKSISKVNQNIKSNNDIKENKKENIENLKKGDREHLFLGTGDFALPLIAVVSMYLINPILGIIGFLAVLFGLELTIWLLFNKKHLALPAIPLQVVSLLIIYGVYLLINLF